MQSGSNLVPESRASHSCLLCREKKKECDRSLPACSSCAMSSTLECKYPSTVADTMEQSVAPAESDMMEDAHARHHGFPAVFFLDSEIFQRTQVGLPRINLPFAENLLDNIRDVQSIADRYFGDVHLWMPILSKHRFYDGLIDLRLQSDRAILVFCMKLVSWLPVEHAANQPKTPAYRFAKEMFAQAELVAGVLTIQLLQAMILLSIYEMGHAIYPAAYFTIAGCARYGIALGIDQKPSDPASPSFDEMEQGERTRAWWAILILERFMNLGCPKRASVVIGPARDHPMPARDEEGWDKGEKLDHSVENGRDLFARLAKSAGILEMVFRQVGATPVDEEAQRTKRLDQLLDLFPKAPGDMGKIGGVDLSSAAMCFSGYLLLYEHFSNKKPVADRVSFIGDLADCLLDEKTGANPPIFLIHCVYYAVKIIRRAGKSGNEERLRFLKLKLAALRQRWMLAGAYLRILKADAVMDMDGE